MYKYLFLLLTALACGQFLSAQTGHIVIPSGHTKTIEKILVDKQAKYMYSLESGKVIMWDFKTRDQLYSFPNDFQKTMAVSNDGTKLLVGVYCYSTITGKFLFQIKGYSPVFSADDKDIYSFESGKVCMTDITTQEKAYISEYISFGMAENFMVNKDHFLLTENDGWILYNVTEKKIEQQGKNRIVYHPGLHAIAYKDEDNYIYIKDIFNGALIGKIKATNPKLKFYPSANSKNFIIDQNSDITTTDWTVYDGETLKATGKFKHSFENAAILFFDDGKRVYASNAEDVVIINTKTSSVINKFERQVAKIGQETYSALEYNYNNNVLNFIADDSVYKSVNMVQLKPVRHQLLPEFNTIAFSATGDSVAIFGNDNKVVLKNLATSKQLIPSYKLLNEASATEAKNFFFTTDGTYAYYTVHNEAKDVYILNRINTATGKAEPVVTFKGTHWPIITLGKDILAAFDEGYQYNHAKVWNVASGKLLFDKDMGEKDGRYINVSADKKEVMIVTTEAIEKYNIITNALLSTTPSSISFTYDNFAATPDFSVLFASDAYGSLIAEKQDGTKLYEVKLHDATITHKFFSANGSLIYTVSEDQSIKVSLAATGKLLGTLYLFNDGNDYVFIMPDGRFDGSEGGMQRMYYYQDRIKLTLVAVFEKYFTPNLYQRLLAGETFDPVPDLVFKPKPVIKIQYAEKQRNLEIDDDAPSYQNTTGAAEITVTASSEDDAIDEIRLFQNGKVLNLATRNLIVEDDKSKTSTKKYTVNLLLGTNEIRAIALNTQRTESDPDIVNVVYNDGASANTNVTPAVDNNSHGIVDKIDKNATLHLLVVGINAYQNSKMSLNYALADATAFKDEVEKDAKSVITNIQTYFVTDNAADKTGIVKALQQVQQNAKPQDVFVFYYAGHGVIANGNKEFYLVPNDVTDLHNVDEALKEHGIAAKDLQQYAINIQAQKQLFILDACQSAGAFADMLSSDGNQQKNIALVARSTGTHWIAASGAQQFANEFSSLGHGAFTYVLLQALKGEAASNKMITVNNLKSFLQVQVPVLMKKYNGAAQYPASYGFGNDFPVEVVK